ncbi:MAG TPA: hypothetical protein ENI90_09775, partial [Methylothermaceae bacterium]|nr:hypothetical protein [Methylothermaceae bacterium]
VQQVDGTLLRSLRLQGLRYQSEAMNLSSSSVRLIWRPRALWHGQLHIQRIEVTGLILEPAAEEAKSREAPTLPQIASPLPVTIDRLIVDRLTLRRPGAEAAHIDRIEMSLALTAHRLQLRQAQVKMATFQLQSHGLIQLQDHYPLSLWFNWRYLPDFEGGGKLEGDLRQLTLNHRIGAPFTVTTSGTLTRLLQRPGFDLQGQWQQIHWPFAGTPQWQAHQGRFRLRGTPDDYRVTLTTGLTGRHLPPARLQLRAEGNLEGFENVTARAKGRAGTLTAAGKVRWDPAVSWNLRLEGSDIDPGQWQPDWPGSLDLSALCEGRLEPGLQVSLALEHLQGRLRGQPLSASGKLVYRNRQLHSDAFDLSWGNNQLQLQGFAGRRQLDLSFHLDAPRLDVIDPDLAGDLKGQGRISGRPTRPRVHLSLLGHRIRWAGRISLRRLRLEARGHPQDPDSRLRLQIYLLQTGDWRFDQIRVNASGSFRDHRLRLKARGPLGQILVTARGSHRPGRTSSWDGQVSQLPLTLLQPLLPGETSVSGNLTAYFSYRQWPGGRSGQLRWRLPRAIFATVIEPGRRLSLAASGGRGSLRLENRHLQADLKIPFPGHGLIQADFATALDTRRMEGQARLDFARLQLVEILIPQLRDVSGRLHGKLQLAGTWQQPVIGLDIGLENGSARVIPAGIRIQQAQLQIIGGTGGPIAISGQIRSGPGRIDIQGKTWLQPRPGLSLLIRGDRFEAVSLPQTRILVSPDLKVRADPKVVRLSGVVRLPQADIKLRKTLFPEQTPEMVSVSEDEIIIGLPGQPQRRHLNIIARVQLVLGEKVHFLGYGLDTKLKGKLTLTTRHAATAAEGVIHLVEGRFIAYGQKLDIKSGRIIFSGPVDNPAFDIHIVRQIRRDQVTVTLKITGFANDPQLQIDSEPPLPEEDAIAYLLAGRPFTRAGETGENGARAAVSKALASLGVTYLNKLGLEKIAQVEFEAGSLVIGKYLLAELYVGYAVDIFTGIGEVLLRYEVTPRIHVEARSGESQSVDVFYTLETD